MVGPRDLHQLRVGASTGVFGGGPLVVGTTFRSEPSNHGTADLLEGQVRLLASAHSKVRQKRLAITFSERALCLWNTTPQSWSENSLKESVSGSGWIEIQY
jgi:hypothetical protein